MDSPSQTIDGVTYSKVGNSMDGRRLFVRDDERERADQSSTNELLFVEDCWGNLAPYYAVFGLPDPPATGFDAVP